MARRTFAQILDRVAMNVGRHSSWTDPPATDIVASVQRELTEAFQWSFRKRVTLFQTIAPYRTGTVTVTLGSPNVTGAGTAWTAGMVGRAIRLANEVQYFYVQAVTDATHLVLGDLNQATIPWGQPTAAAQTYAMFPIQYPLPADLDDVLFPTRDWKIYSKTVELFDRIDPLRTSTGRPTMFARSMNRQISGVESMMIEFYPIPDAIYTMRMPYLRRALDPIVGTDIPLVPTELVEQLGTIQALSYLHIKSGDSRYLEQIDKVWGPKFTSQYRECLQEDQDRYGLPDSISADDAQYGADYLQAHDVGFP